MPAEGFTNLMYSNEESSICASDNYEEEPGVFEYVPFAVNIIPQEAVARIQNKGLKLLIQLCDMAKLLNDYIQNNKKSTKLQSGEDFSKEI
ncbi:hypothetical protein WISP_113039 [Willisornis vidua]|uniref:Uncharacterized protein n=1 Tax=Willisornis vidua TaxID=1566151 RepID=A0ABQ9CV18_9PASS|nr:hypothetical protein WISP_113039 [Willisornis vidua]